MPGVGIVGSGISALHLALLLQQLGVDPTLYADKTPDELRAGRLPNTVMRFEATRRREQALAVDHWGGDHRAGELYGLHFSFGADPPFQLRGDFRSPGSMVDFRLYLARLLEDYAARGGRARFEAPSVDRVLGIAEHHDLVVVATGARTITELFPPVLDHTPYHEPQRILMAGLFTGIEETDRSELTLSLVPGGGEIFQGVIHSFGGPASNLLVEAVPGGPLEPVVRLRYDDAPAVFEAALLDVLREHAPTVFARTDPAAFGLTRPLDLLQGAVRPVVRRAWTVLPDGTLAMALGDSWVVNDPISGQGANLGSFCAQVMAESIVDNPTFDADFGRRVEARMWQWAGPVTYWSNSLLQPPPPHVVAMFVAGTVCQAVADALVDGFSDPPEQWSRFSSPQGAAAFLGRHGLALADFMPSDG